MGVWFWIVVVVAVVGGLGGVGERSALVQQRHQQDRDANRQRVDDARGRAPTM